MDKVRIIVFLFSSTLVLACSISKNEENENLNSYGCDISTVKSTIDCMCEMTAKYKKVLVDRSDAEKPAEMLQFDEDVKKNIENGVYTDEELELEFEKRNGCDD